MWPGCGEGAGGLGGDIWLYLVQLPDPPDLPSLHSFPAPGFPSDPEQAGSTRKVSSSSYSVCPSSPPFAGKTKPEPLWGPEGTLCEVNPVLPPLFHSGDRAPCVKGIIGWGWFRGEIHKFTWVMGQRQNHC